MCESLGGAYQVIKLSGYQVAFRGDGFVRPSCWMDRPSAPARGTEKLAGESTRGRRRPRPGPANRTLKGLPYGIELMKRGAFAAAFMTPGVYDNVDKDK